MQDEELKKLLPKLLPGRVYIISNAQSSRLYWLSNTPNTTLEVEVQDNQLLSLCREVEDSLDEKQASLYIKTLINKNNWRDSSVIQWHLTHASWQQRIQDVAEVMWKI